MRESVKRWVKPGLIVAGAMGLIAAGFAMGVGLTGHRAHVTGTSAHVSGASTEAHSDTKYTCGMHPNVIQDGPGTCPICGMNLTPVKPPPPEKDYGTGAYEFRNPWVDFGAMRLQAHLTSG
jgi:hypothetical protein